MAKANLTREFVATIDRFVSVVRCYPARRNVDLADAADMLGRTVHATFDEVEKDPEKLSTKDRARLSKALEAMDRYLALAEMELLARPVKQTSRVSDVAIAAEVAAMDGKALDRTLELMLVGLTASKADRLEAALLVSADDESFQAAFSRFIRLIKFAIIIFLIILGVPPRILARLVELLELIDELIEEMIDTLVPGCPCDRMLQLVETFFAAYERGDIGRILRGFQANGGKLTMSGEGRITWGGVHQGPRALEDIFRRMAGDVTVSEFKVVESRCIGQSIMIRGRYKFTCRRPGAVPFEGDFFHFWVFDENCKVVSVDAMFDPENLYNNCVSTRIF